MEHVCWWLTVKKPGGRKAVRLLEYTKSECMVGVGRDRWLKEAYQWFCMFYPTNLKFVHIFIVYLD